LCPLKLRSIWSGRTFGVVFAPCRRSGSPAGVSTRGAGLDGARPGADLMGMTAAPLPPAAIPEPRHRADDDGTHVRVAAAEERSRTGRHAAPEDDDRAGDDPLAWLGFRFEPA
jgi:hypothetical protein